MAPLTAFTKTVTRWFAGETRTQRATLNMVAALLDYGARVVVNFVLNPLLLGGLGTFGFGLWQVLRQLAGYLSPATGRPTQALRWSIAREQASTDLARKRRHVGSTVVVWVMFLPILTSFGALVIWFSPSLLEVPRELVWSTRIAAALLVATMIVAIVAEVPRSVLIGENLAYKRMGLSAALIFAGGALMALALHLEYGLVGVAAAPLATAVLTGLLFLWVVKRHVPWFGIHRPSWAEVRRFTALSGWFLVWRFVMKAMLASDLVLLGLFDSVERVTPYALTKYLPQTVIDVVAMLVVGVLPGLGGIIGASDLPRASRVRSELMALTWLIAVTAGVTILLWNQSFVQLWVGPEQYAGATANLLILLVVLQFVLIRNDANVIDLTLNLRNKVLLGATSTALSVGLAAALLEIWEFGIVGLCLGLIAGRALLSVLYPLMVGRILGLSLASQARAALRPALVGALLFVGAVRLDDLARPDGWLGLVVGSLASAALVLLLAFFAGLPASLRGSLLERARKLLSERLG